MVFNHRVKPWAAIFDAEPRGITQIPSPPQNPTLTKIKDLEWLSFLGFNQND